ncbi:helix-turn-helix domain-containing protein [Deinococcus sp. MIMF12]|uniref:Helix-turn-helix domain-containing protein n=1 Tax=Deinococcus rhizophilus TaxID=3049544 RepID=A0ABT7JDF4_9DEIO|nr:helix-turn-helix domain-containing protein [Deinococcus rhizophilus]MDL2343094.1 helix-turn-helix domain-containing protein [Deinococcus rhizophilus]
MKTFRPAPEDAPVMLRPSQIVKRYSLPRDRVYRAISSGELPAYDAGSPARPAFLIREAHVEAWLESLRVAPTAPRGNK